MIHSKTACSSFFISIFLTAIFGASALDAKKTAPTNAKGTGESSIPGEVDDWDTLNNPSGSSKNYWISKIHHG